MKENFGLFLLRRIVKSSATPQNDTIQTVSGNLKSFVVVY